VSATAWQRAGGIGLTPSSLAAVTGLLLETPLQREWRMLTVNDGTVSVSLSAAAADVG